jgi:anti-sigma28 factor (negative regulator of flagellin synthesis)
MRIKGRSEIEQEAVLSKRIEKGVTEGSSRPGAAKVDQSRGALGGADRVDVGLAQYINQEMNVVDMEKKRRERVEELKRLVQNGQYNPKSEDVARAVGEEIVMEIMTAAGRGSAR